MYYRVLGQTLFVLIIILSLIYNYLISLYHRNILLFFLISLAILAIILFLVTACIINYRQKKGFYKSPFWINLAREIRTRDNYTCQKMRITWMGMFIIISQRLRRIGRSVKSRDPLRKLPSFTAFPRKSK